MEGRGDRISGTVQAVVFQNPENGYTVLRLRLDGGETVTAVGPIPGAAAGEGLTLTGRWESHPSYGAQFKAEAAERSLPTGADDIYRYLASGVIKGVGAKTAQLLVSRFGAATLRIIEEEPERLTEIKGITEKKAREINARFIKAASLRRLMDFLLAYGIPPFTAARLYRAYGEEAKTAVTENPYILADDYFGLDFFEADAFAIALGFSGSAPERIEASVLFELRHNRDNGHVFIPRDKLVAAAAQLIGAEPESVDSAVSDLLDGGYIIEDTVAGLDAIYLEELHRDECAVAERLLELAAMRPPAPKNINALLRRAEEGSSVKFAPTQQDAVIMAATSCVMVLTGGPGTGKTTTVRGILELYEAMGIKTLIAAPTGRAAKRMGELTGRDADTVHRLLGAAMPDEEREARFQKCASDPLDCGAVVLDESSMMDVSLMAALLDAMPPRARLIMVGDADQLPSVGPGNVFGDIIRSGTVPVFRLTEIFRQARESEIVKNAHLINSGTVPEVKNAGDMYFLRRPGGAGVAETVVSLVSERLPEKMGIPRDEIQVLSPSRKTEAGTAELNLRLQAALNPPGEEKREKALTRAVFRAGDRVMQTRNNYDLVWYRHPEGKLVSDGRLEAGAGVYNGDVGYIEDIDEVREFVLVRFEDRLTPYPFDMLGDLELSYAVTVHKSQGSEYRAVVLALPRGVPMLKTRAVLYTAVTRAKELLIIVGDPADLAEMVMNDRRQRRYSGLRARLAGEIGR